ncbi:MAG: helix-turn-helix domain-containing protein [Pseudomonadota bacterium]
MGYDIIHISGKPHFLVPVHEFTELQNGANDLPDNVREELALGQKHPIKVLRKYRGMTQGDLASASGISRPYITEIETGRKDGSVRALKAIADSLDISLDALVN